MAINQSSVSTRAYTVDTDFAGLLSEDFGIAKSAVCAALLNEPKRAAIEICEWATGTDDASRALRNWAMKNGRGTFKPKPVPTEAEVAASTAFFDECMRRKRERVGTLAANYGGSSAHIGT